MDTRYEPWTPEVCCATTEPPHTRVWAQWDMEDGRRGTRREMNTERPEMGYYEEVRDRKQEKGRGEQGGRKGRTKEGVYCMYKGEEEWKGTKNIYV